MRKKEASFFLVCVKKDTCSPVQMCTVRMCVQDCNGIHLGAGQKMLAVGNAAKLAKQKKIG